MVSLQKTRVINLAVGCHYFPPGRQLPSQPLRGLLPILLLDEQRHDWCEQSAQDCYPTASRLQFEPRPYAPESSMLTTRLPSHPSSGICWTTRKSIALHSKIQIDNKTNTLSLSHLVFSLPDAQSTIDNDTKHLRQN